MEIVVEGKKNEKRCIYKMENYMRMAGMCERDVK